MLSDHSPIEPENKERPMRNTSGAGLTLWLSSMTLAMADEAPVPLQEGVRGLVVRASGPVAVDGKLREWSGAFCTPVHHAHGNLANRAAQFFYLWDDEAFYVGLRALDQR